MARAGTVSAAGSGKHYGSRPEIAEFDRQGQGAAALFLQRPPTVDKLLAMTMAIAGELAVARERQDTVERILSEKGLLSAAEIDAWRPDETAKQERAALRQEYISRVLMILQNELEELEQQKAASDYGGIAGRTGAACVTDKRAVEQPECTS